MAYVSPPVPKQKQTVYPIDELLDAPPDGFQFLRPYHTHNADIPTQNIVPDINNLNGKVVTLSALSSAVYNDLGISQGE